MRLEEIYWSRVLEQLNRDDDENNQNEPPIQLTRQTPKKPIDVLKDKWKNESPGLSDPEINEAITSFNNRKNNLRPIHTPPTVGDMPELVSLKAAFPNFPCNDIQKLKDIQSYSWEQLIYLLDRFSITDTITNNLDYNVIGDTIDQQIDYMIEKWENFPGKIIDENGLIVCRIESEQESSLLGQMQPLAISKWVSTHPEDRYNWRQWCVTYKRGVDNNTNLYSSYRIRRSFYFILDKNRRDSTNKEEFKHFISAIQPSIATQGYNEGPYVVNNASNSGERQNLTWDTIVRIWPGLSGKEPLFRFFNQTKKEKASVTLDKISFEPESEYYFGKMSPAIQTEYINNNRSIRHPEAFLTLSENLQKEYVSRTTRDNYKERFLPRQNAKNPFEMLMVLKPAHLRFLHQEVLINQCGFPEGINSVKTAILQYRYWPHSRDINNNSVFMFSLKSDKHIFGVIDLSTYTWTKDTSYILQKHALYKSPNNEGFNLLTFIKNDGSDLFGWLYPYGTLTKAPENKVHAWDGYFLESQDAISAKLQNYKRI